MGYLPCLQGWQPINAQKDIQVGIQPTTDDRGGMQTDMHLTTNDQRPTTNKVLRILFVCTGNTCRSPMAEGLCRSFLGHYRLQQEVEVASAGLNAVAGEPASREAVEIMRERGIDLSGHKTTGLTAEKVRWPT